MGYKRRGTHCHETRVQTETSTMKSSLVLSAVVAVAQAAGLRPQVHFSPHKGFMNDPNGLFFDDKRSIYHYYYQCELNETILSWPVYMG